MTAQVDTEKAHNMSVANISQPGTTTTKPQSSPSLVKSLLWLDRFLAIWIFLAMGLGMILGAFVPSASRNLQRGKFVGVSIPISVGLLVMMYPILCRVRYVTVSKLLWKRVLWKQLSFSVIINWVVAPLFMMALAWAFLPDQDELRMGLIIVGLGRCIAMVLIWSSLAGGDEEYCALLVAVNSLLQMVLFAPLFWVLLWMDSSSSKSHFQSTPPFAIVAKSVGVFLGVPLGAALITQGAFLSLGSEKTYSRFLKFIAPFSLLGLLYTIVALFASQGSHVVDQIASVARVAAPLVVYFLVLFFAVFFTARNMNFGYELSTTQALTAASNNFELAIAVSVAIYGADSGQALAATVGPLVEVPVLLGLVYTNKWLRERLAWT